MTRLIAICGAAILAAAVSGATGRANIPNTPALQSATSRARPNIVWISNEDMSPHLGAYGDKLARTPVLDRLAKESIRYTRAFTTAPVCAPSRAAIITGMYQNAIGAQHMRTTEDRVPELPGPYLAVPPFYVKAFPEYLRAAGYFTSNRAKTDYQFGVPFTIWDDLGREAHWRNRPDKSQPFFSVFNLEVTHESQIFPSSPARKGKPLVTNPASVQVPPYYPDTPLVREELARMYDNIADMDTQVGELLKQLEADGLADNTIVFYWSDHGDGVPRSKRSLYDSGLRVPLMIRWPKGLGAAVAAGTVNDDLVSFVDLAPTVLAAAGVSVPAHLQGRALVGPSAGSAPPFVFAARDRMDIEYDMMRSARDARYLYIRNFAPEQPYAGHIIYRNQSAIMQEWFRLQAEGKLTGAAALWMRTSRPAEELYDTTADAFQIRNLSDDPAHRATLERMRHAVAEWMTRIGDQGLINEPEMIQRMWPGGVQPETAQPYIVSRRTTDAPNRPESMTVREPMEVVIYVPTQGASIGYTTDEGPAPRWRLYTGPILIDKGDDASRESDPLRLQGERGSARHFHETEVPLALRQLDDPFRHADVRQRDLLPGGGGCPREPRSARSCKRIRALIGRILHGLLQRDERVPTGTHARDALAQRERVELVAVDQQDLRDLMAEDVDRGLLRVIEAGVHLIEIRLFDLRRRLDLTFQHLVPVDAGKGVVGIVHGYWCDPILAHFEEVQDLLVHVGRRAGMQVRIAQPLQPPAAPLDERPHHHLALDDVVGELPDGDVVGAEMRVGVIRELETCVEPLVEHGRAAVALTGHVQLPLVHEDRCRHLLGLQAQSGRC